MGKKKIIGLISLIIAILVVSAGVGAFIGSNRKSDVIEQAAKDESSSKKNKAHESSDITNVNKKQSSSAVTSTQSSANVSTASSNMGDFDSLPQKTQLALLINHEFKNSPYMDIPYWPYMGAANKIVMTWDGNGGILNISFLITDNHDGTFTLSHVESSEETLAFMSSKNSYWKATETVSKTTLLSEYEPNKTTVDSVANSIDMSKSAETFIYLPVDQDTMPANDTDDDDIDDDDTDDISDDEY